MAWDDQTPKLEQLVDGEMGHAVLYGLFCLCHASLYELIDSGDNGRYKAAITEARRMVRLLTVPGNVPADARAEWKHTAAFAVEYFRDFMPPFDDDPPHRSDDGPDDDIEF